MQLFCVINFEGIKKKKGIVYETVKQSNITAGLQADPCD